MLVLGHVTSSFCSGIPKLQVCIALIRDDPVFALVVLASLFPLFVVTEVECVHARENDKRTKAD